MKQNFTQKHLGIILVSTLTFKEYLDKSRMTLSFRVNLIHKLAGTYWSTNAETQRIAALYIIIQYDIRSISGMLNLCTPY